MSQHSQDSFASKTVFITGAARRIGAAIAKDLHARGANVVIHYRHSQKAAKELAEVMNLARENSAMTVKADLGNVKALRSAMTRAARHFGQVDALINNASTFYATPFAKASEADWDALIDSNLKGAFFLSQAALPWLQKSAGCIVNITDIFADKALEGFSLYTAAKAGLLNLTQNLALELAPEVRVNAIAPGAILWPENETLDTYAHEKKLAKVPMQRKGEPQDIAQAVRFLLTAEYVTGQVIKVDGGRSLN
ncbi:MAG: pteridine reductase [Gammaproteobacteria bacterium]|nr:pteridine reductase [Gammaproteobacteria bacterium]